MHGNLLMMRWVLLNLSFVVIGGLLWKAGWLMAAWKGDTTYVTSSILFLFGVSFIGLTMRIAQCSTMLDSVRGEGIGRVKEYRLRSKEPWAYEALKTKLSRNVRPYNWVCGVVTLLGFLGTAIGMWTALDGIAHANISDAASVVIVLSSLVSGFSVAIWTTISGIVCSIALAFNVQVLKGGYERLYTQLLERS